MPREILRITPETTFGVYSSSNTPIVVDLPADDSFTVRGMPKFWTIYSAAADNNIIQTGTAMTDIGGSLKLYCRPAQAAFFMNALVAPVSNPSATPPVCADLPSCTIDHGIYIEDGTCLPQMSRYLGCKFDGGFSLSNSDDGILMMLDLSIVGASYAPITTTDFPIPAYTAYDRTESPFALEMLAGNFLYGGADISPYVESLSFKIGNKIRAFRAATKYVSRVGYFGREPSIDMGLLYYTQQFRLDFNANTPKPLALTFTDAAGDTLLIQFGATNYIRSVSDRLSLSDFHKETVTLINTVNPATGTDISVTYTPHS